MLKLPGIYPQHSTRRLCGSQNITQGLRKLKGLKGFKEHLSQVRHSLQCCKNRMVIKAFPASKVALIYLRGGKLLAGVSHFLPFAWKRKKKNQFINRIYPERLQTELRLQWTLDNPSLEKSCATEMSWSNAMVQTPQQGPLEDRVLLFLL